MPKHKDIATILRAEIKTGHYPVDTSIPREVDLATRFEVDRSTVRRAIGLLRAERLVRPTKRRGTVVRDQTRIALPATRYTDATTTQGPWEIACAQQGLEGHTLVLGVSERPAEPTEATALGLDVGDILIHRLNHMTVKNKDCVIQIQQTFLPMSIARGTPLAAPGKVVGGIYRGLTDAGHPPALANQTVIDRAADPDESEILDLDGGSGVLDIRRTTLGRSGLALVHVHLVVCADRVSLTSHEVL